MARLQILLFAIIPLCLNSFSSSAFAQPVQDTIILEYSNDTLIQRLTLIPVNDTSMAFIYKVIHYPEESEISIRGIAFKICPSEVFEYRKGFEFLADRFVYKEPNCKLILMLQSELFGAAWIIDDCLRLQLNPRNPVGSVGLLQK